MANNSTNTKAWLLLFFSVVGASAFGLWRFGLVDQYVGAAKGDKIDFKEDLVPEAKDPTLDLEIVGDTFTGYWQFKDDSLLSILSKDHDVDIRFKNVFNQKIRAGLLDEDTAIVTTADKVRKYLPEGGKIVMLLDRTEGADAMFFNNGGVCFEDYTLETFDDLGVLAEEYREREGEKLKIVVAGDSPSSYLLKLLAEQYEGLRLSDYTLLEVDDASEAWQMMQGDCSIGAAVLWSPYTGLATEDGYGLAGSTKELPRAIVDVLVVHKSTLSNHPEQVRAMIKELYFQSFRLNSVRSARWQQSDSHPDLVVQKIAEVTESNEDVVRDYLKGVHAFTPQEAQQWMEDGTLLATLKKAQGVYYQYGDITSLSEDVEALYTSAFLDEAVAAIAKEAEAVKATGLQVLPLIPQETSVIAESVTDEEVREAKGIGNLSVSESIQFELGEATLTAEGVKALDRLIVDLNQYSEVAVRLDGYASKPGGVEANIRLTQARVTQVKSYLENAGVTLKIVATGHGFDQDYADRVLPGVDYANSLHQRVDISLVRLAELVEQ